MTRFAVRPSASYAVDVARSAFELSRRALSGSPALLPGFLTFVLVLYWSARDGGFDPLRWLPGTLFLLALLAVMVIAAKPGPLPRATLLALVSLSGFTVWSFLSITWAGVPADAWLGANKTLLYLCVFALFVLFPWNAGAAASVAGGFAVGVAVLGVTTIIRLSVASDPTTWFVGGKLTAPIAYANANTALYVMAFVPALYLSMRREIHPLLRGVLLAAAGVLPQLALMIQSRTSVAALPVTLTVLFLVVPGRMRSFVALVLAGLATAATSGVMLGVYGPALEGVGLGEAVADARTALLASALVLGMIGVTIGLIDRRWRVSRDTRRVLRVAVACLVAAAFLTGSTVVVARDGAPWTLVGGWVTELRDSKAPVSSPGTAYLASGLGGNRYDIWRVAWTLFREHPIGGIGVDNFSVDNVRLRRSLNDSAYPHSIELRVLSQTGLVGASLLVFFLGAAIAGVFSSIRHGSDLARGVAGATSAAALYWLVHGSAEWFWEMPVLAVTAFAFTGIAMRLEPSSSASNVRRVPPAILIAGGGAAIVVAVLSVSFPWLAARDIDAALRGWPGDPAASFSRLERARSLNPLTDEADVFAGVIAGEVGETARQRAAFVRALERNPDNWYPYLELGVLDARAGRRAAGLRHLATARALNPLEPAVIVVQDWLKEGRVPTRDDLDKLLLSRANHLQGGTP